jgi:hypothetical protein
MIRVEGPMRRIDRRVAQLRMRATGNHSAASIVASVELDLTCRVEPDAFRPLAEQLSEAARMAPDSRLDDQIRCLRSQLRERQERHAAWERRQYA